MQSRARSTAALLACTAVLAAGCGDSPTAGAPGSAPPSPERAGERVAEILALDDPLRRAAELGALLAGLDAEALPAVREAFGEASLDRGDTEVVLFVTWWAGFDPEGARVWSTRAWTAAHLSVLGAVFRTWAGSDPQTAWRHAQGLPNPLQRELASDAVIVGWHESGAPGLDAFVDELPPGETRQRAADTLARRRALQLGAAGALEWVEGLGESRFKELMRARVAGAAAWLDPEAAAAWARPQIDGSYRTSGLARRVATRWVRSDPEAAMAWLAALPAGGDRRDGVLEAYRDWQTLRQSEAVAWIERQDLEPWLEPAFSLYARGPLAHRDPEAALELASRISDVDRRHGTITYIARGWLQRDREAADAWLQQSDLPEAVLRRAYMLPSRATRAERERSRAQRTAAATGGAVEHAGSD